MTKTAPKKALTGTYAAAQLRAFKSSSGLTQKAIAEAVGVEQQSVSRWLTGIARPESMVMRFRLATFTGGAVEVDGWYTDEERRELKATRGAKRQQPSA